MKQLKLISPVSVICSNKVKKKKAVTLHNADSKACNLIVKYRGNDTVLSYRPVLYG